MSIYAILLLLLEIISITRFIDAAVCACHRIIHPVLGPDGKLYGNFCHLQCTLGQNAFALSEKEAGMYTYVFWNFSIFISITFYNKTQLTKTLALDLELFVN
ncbi:hypothetical protein ILUMI_06552 [Ignelater luminosus]|uniref:Kazal-like domain-containing protein n=1 Tax=Ignelater luminosus TaxID=2038154 RepID=A0A8K0GCG7_IGNLU|nr:hypothetical protein ILUMI_06552 [Ignelater luminosus]